MPVAPRCGRWIVANEYKTQGNFRRPKFLEQAATTSAAAFAAACAGGGADAGAAAGTTVGAAALSECCCRAHDECGSCRSLLVHASYKSGGDRSLSALDTNHGKSSDTWRNSGKQNVDDEEAAQTHGTAAARRREEPATTRCRHKHRCLCDRFVGWVGSMSDGKRDCVS